LGEGEVSIYKGDTLLNGNYDLIDSLVKNTNIDVTFFYKDLRVISTVMNKSNSRAVNIACNAKVKLDVLDAGKSKFYKNVKLNGESYYAYYKLIRNSDGSVIGMVETIKSAKTVYLEMFKRLILVYIVGILGIVLIVFTSKKYTKTYVSIIEKLKKEFANLSKGKIDGKIDGDILARNDEFGSMAKSVVKMQTAIRAMIELDSLTHMNNRRIGDQKLSGVILKSRERRIEYTVALADIDYFKRVNDEYGHHTGDLVLKSVASILTKAVQNKGFVCRWEGEEFLLVFDKYDYNSALKYLEKVLEKIRKTPVNVGGKEIFVTLSVGATKGLKDDKNNTVVKRADELLYRAKATGRNKIVSDF